MQLSFFLSFKAVDIANISVIYLYIILLNFIYTTISNENSIRNVKVLQFAEALDSELHNTKEAKKVPFLNPIKCIASIEHFEHLSNQLYLSKSERNQI